MTRFFATTTLLAILMCGPGWTDTQSDHRATYRTAIALQNEAPAQSAALLQELADQGYARALDRLAYFYTKGIGVPQDLDAARDLYAQAIAAGYTRSLISLGRTQLKLGAYADADKSLRAAIEDGQDKAAPLLAWAHATGRLGTLSEPEQGLADLHRIASEGSRDAQVYLMAALIKHPEAEAPSPKVFTDLHALAEGGDAKAAEALLRYYRLRDDKTAHRDERVELIKTPGMRDKIRIEEGLHLAFEVEPERFWLASEDLVRPAPNETFARALTVTAKLNKNAYVRILQQELTALGYAAGRPSPYLTSALIRSVNQFCTDQDMQDACALGPLKSSVVKSLSAALSERRTPA